MNEPNRPNEANEPRIWPGIIVGTLLIEAFTCLLRFGLKLESTRDTASTIGRLTMGLRIHHSYIGAAIVLLVIPTIHRYPKIARYLLIVGASLILSDLIHHFVVLAYWVGDPQFDLWY
ncbi:hypothetical protein [Stieleria varia]|uniref:Uncharacterized protein n=1 Tax=Stieleria varia TaxID=2528005 RepID=A0A5C6B3V3_9BACT|nr:hypothetical protein [Stieleria varia]TWU06437.1 hypothetical protein Pla52n_21580 [Stieleria varia]